jgi:hypothetical protein
MQEFALAIRSRAAASISRANSGVKNHVSEIRKSAGQISVSFTAGRAQRISAR